MSCSALTFPGPTEMLGLLQDHSPQITPSTASNRPRSLLSQLPERHSPSTTQATPLLRDTARLLNKKVPMCLSAAIKSNSGNEQIPRDIKCNRELTLDSLAYRFMGVCLGFSTIPSSEAQQHKEVEFDYSFFPASYT